MATTADYLAELKNQQALFAAKLAAEGTGATPNDSFNSLVEQAKSLHGTEQTYNPKSQKAQSGIAVAEGIDESVGDINGALSSLVNPSDIDPSVWMDETVEAAVEEIKAENQETIATEVEAAVNKLSAENTATIKSQIAKAVEDLDLSTRRAFLSNAKRITNGNITLQSNTIYVIARVPDGNTLTLYDPQTLETVTLSDRHYLIIVGNESDDVSGAVCATVFSYPSLDPQLYLVSKEQLQGTITWTGTAIYSEVKNAPIE